MKKIVIFILSQIFVVAFASVPKTAWELSDGIVNPESVYFDKESKNLFVSNVSGTPNEKDGVGWIQKLDTSGKVVAQKWVSGLDAPKGMRSHKGILWVSNIDEMVSIDIAAGKITNRIKIPNSKFLNDVAIDAEGRVYVSDTLSSKIFRIENGTSTLFAEGDELESPNGLLIQTNKLVVAAWGLTTDFSTKVPGNLYTLDLETKKKSLITRAPLGNLDGLEVDKKGNYLVSDWKAGKTYRVGSRGTVTLLLEGFQGAADLAFLPAEHLLIVPRMNENKISAYDYRSFK